MANCSWMTRIVYIRALSCENMLLPFKNNKQFSLLIIIGIKDNLLLFNQTKSPSLKLVVQLNRWFWQGRHVHRYRFSHDIAENNLVIIMNNLVIIKNYSIASLENLPLGSRPGSNTNQAVQQQKMAIISILDL